MSDKKVVLITGCSTGIGAALASTFAEQGCTVYASARKLDALGSLSPEIKRLALDVVDFEQCKDAVEFIVGAEGKIDVLINNAGMGGVGAMLDYTIEDMRRTYDVNVFAPLRLAQLVAPHMCGRRSGLIINVGSVAGLVATPWSGVYSSSKAALHSWTDALRMELQPFNVHVMLVAPGAITSKFGDKQMESFKLPENSLYKPVADKIAGRATASQDQGDSMPAGALAKMVASHALLRSPPSTYLSAGGKSWTFYILWWLPSWLRSSVLSKRLGCDGVIP